MKRNINVFGDSDEDTEDDDSRSKLPVTKKKFKIPTIDQSKPEKSEELEQDYMSFVVPEAEVKLHEESNSQVVENKLDKSLFKGNHKSIGLSIMEKMGYKVGGALGMSEDAIKEPVKVSLRTGRRGIGGEIKTSEYKEEDAEKLKLKLTSAEKERIEAKDIQKMMKLAFELSGEYDDFLDGMKNVDDINPLWRPYAYTMLRRKDLRKVQSIESKSKIIDQQQLYEEKEKEDSDKILAQLLDYLRHTHSYCWYCGVQYSNHDELEINCPGKDRDIHLLSR